VDILFTQPGKAPRRGGRLLVRSALSPGQLLDSRKQLFHGLTRFAEDVVDAGKRNSWPDLARAVTDLFDLGRAISNELFGASDLAVANFCQDALPAWERPRQAAPSAGMEAGVEDLPPVPLVEVEAGIEDVLPVEFLPLLCLDPGSLPVIENKHTLAAAFRRFLGFAAVIKRVIPRLPVPAARRLENRPQLPLKFFRHLDLHGAEMESAFLGRDARVSMEGPWPDAPLTDVQLLAAVAGCLRDPGHGLNGAARVPPDQIYHFSCHCDTTANSRWDHYLALSNQGSSPPPLTYRKLSTFFGPPGGGIPPQGTPVRPLIFLNACASVGSDLSGVATFPFLFLRNAHLGFLGAEVAIPDQVAAVFAQEFYRSFLKGLPFGRAVYEAKWALLDLRNNPLGLVYVFHGNPDLRVRYPVPPPGG
jgi:hypothetical protein